jgi:tetratricopeptide (TPR) repeat protein
MMTTRTNSLVLLGLFSAAVLFGAGGCAGLQGGGADGPDAPAAEAAIQAPAAEAGEQRPEVEVRELGRIIEMLQDGQYGEGRSALQAYLQHDPRSAVAKGLLRQLETDPVQLLGAAHEAYEVRPGDTLGGIAARHLGDPLSFVALARYNGIARPKALTAGQLLKLPVKSRAASASGAAVVPSETRNPRLQAIEDDLAAGRIDAAQAGIARLRVDGGVPAERLTALAQRARGLQHQQRGLVLLQAGRNEEAYAAFEQALRIVPDLEPAGRQSTELRKRLVSDYHEAAVVHYRNQRLEEAIGLWDKALALDPAFEPARGYRTRALELRRRLRALDNS